MSVETLAQALLEAGILDATSVEMRVPRVRSGRQLLDGIIADGLMTENNLVSQLARALSVPRYDPKERSPEPDALTLLDLRSCEELGVLPVAVRGGGALLWVAMCDPTDEQVAAEVTRRTGRRVKPCLIGPKEMVKALQGLGGVATAPTPQPQPSNYPPPTSAQFRVPLPSTAPPNPSVPMMNSMPSPMNGMPPMPSMPYGGMPNVMPSMQPMPGMPQGGYPSYGYPGQAQMPMQHTMPPGMAAQMLQGMQGQQQQSYIPTGHTAPIATQRPGETTQRLEDELNQARQVVKVLVQMLVERGLLDGEELKRRLRAERERK
jgi:hypothetical protein